MKINPITIISGKKNPVKTSLAASYARVNLLSKDSVTFTSRFDEQAMRERLCNLEDDNGEPCLSSVQVNILIRECSDTKKLASLVMQLSDDVLKNLDWNNFCYIASEYDFPQDDYFANIALVNKMPKELLVKFASLTQLIFAENIHTGMLLQSLKDNNAVFNPDIQKIFVKSKKTSDDEFKNVYRYCDKNGELLSKDTVLFYSNGEIKLQEREVISESLDSGLKSERQIRDFSSNKQYLVDSDISKVSKKTLIPKYELCVENGDDGIKSITYRYHTSIAGVYNVCEIIPGEEPTNIAFATQNDDEIHVRKKMKSYEGVSTFYSLDLKKDGQKTLTYVVTDPSGKVLMSKSSVVQKIDADTFLTNVKGRVYISTYNSKDHSISILDVDNAEEKEFTLDRFISPRKREMIDLIMSMEAPELERLLTNTTALHECSWYQSHYDNFESFDIHTDKSLFDLHHELGHAIDFNNGAIGGISCKLSTRQDFLEILQQEKDCYNSNSTVTQRDFIRHLCGDSKRLNTASESFAEAYALLNSIQEHDEISSRTDYFQQHFPRTIAKVYEILNE